jgi:hypothetical protein
MDAQRASISAPGWQAGAAKLQPINEMFDAQSARSKYARRIAHSSLPRARATESPE